MEPEEATGPELVFFAGDDLLIFMTMALEIIKALI